MNPFSSKYYGVKSKNVGPFLAFSAEWFKKHQYVLLFLLNCPVIRLWFRWVLRIHNDCKYSDIIIEIEPNNYKTLQLDGKIKGDFRTHQKFSKRIYFAFLWWWWVLHYIDELFKVAELSPAFGFDTLTAYPDPDPETSTVDGFTLRNTGAGTNESLNTIRSGLGSYAYSATNPDFILDMIGDSGNNTFKRLSRAVYLFLTNIGSGSTISEAIITIKGLGTQSGLGSENMVICSSSPASNTNLSTTDYSNFGSTSFCSIAYTGTTWNFSLNTDGINNIDKSGVSKFGLRGSWDFNNNYTGTWASDARNYVYGYYSEATGTTNDPKIVITYSSSSINKIAGIAIANVKSASGVAKASIKKIVGIA